MKKTLVIGSEGMLGRALMKSLLKHDILAEGADIRSQANRVDITNAGEVSNIFNKVKPDLLIHAAAYTDVDGCELNPERAYKINSEGTKNIAEGCMESGTFLIYISTDFVFDGVKEKPYAESDEPRPINTYAKSKLKGEEYIKEIMDSYLIIRTSWLFGDGGKNFVDTIREKAKQEHILQVVDDQKGSPTYADDLAEAITGLLAGNILGEGLGILNITNSGSCTWFEFAREIISMVGLDGVTVEPITSDKVRHQAQRPRYSVLDNGRFAAIYGKKLPSWQDALSRYLYSNKGAEKRQL
ncbi:MAG: dTDP-4-dehydrorhamnose reductase [Candidatus Omnitrophica bacterium]|nr:dTDP-4-dehydrorhamnose reductase [Candidatus Omnitrophota bacterium]